VPPPTPNYAFRLRDWAVTQCKLTGGHPTLIFRRAPGAYMLIAGGYTRSLQCPS
jgi:hypothetical protein